MIMKLQRPLVPAGKDEPWLAYDETRRSKWLIEPRSIPQTVLDALGDDAKGYFEAQPSKGQVIFGPRVADQPW